MRLRSPGSGDSTTSGVQFTLPLEETRARIEREVIQLYEENANGLFRYLAGYSNDLEIAEEAVQEAFLRYYVARVRGESKNEDRAWLFRVARNYLLDRLKEYGHKNRSSIEDIADFPDPAQDTQARYEFEEFSQGALKSLSRREKECLRLRSEGLTYNETAVALKIRSGTVGAMISRAVRKIRASSGRLQENKCPVR